MKTKLRLTEHEVRQYYIDARDYAAHMDHIHWPYTRQRKCFPSCMSHDWLIMYKRLQRYERTFSEQLGDAIEHAPPILFLVMVYVFALGCIGNPVAWMIAGGIFFVQKVKQ